MPAAPYLIAVASDGDEPEVPDSLFYNPRWIWHLEEQRLQVQAEASKQLAMAAEEAGEKMAAATAENAALRQEMATLFPASERAELVAMNAALRQQMATLFPSSEKAELAAMNAALRREVAALQAACEKAELAALIATQSRAPAQSLQQNHDEAEMLRRSTSWRITAPLRAVARVIKRVTGR